MPRRVIFLVLLTALPVSAQIYKYIDAQGHPAYSNQPPDGAPSETVELPPLNRVEARPPAPSVPAPPRPDSSGDAYNVLELTGLPTDEALRANNGTFTVDVLMQPRLQPGHLLQLAVDGKPYGTASSVPRLQIVSIDRGQHTMAVWVVSGEQIIQKSPSITTTVQRVHVGKP